MSIESHRVNLGPRLAIGLVLLGATGACEREINTPVADAEVQAVEGPVVFGMLSYVTDSGVREGRIEADTAFLFEETSSADLRQMTIVFYDEAGAETATVSGVQGEWNRETNLMVAKGDVVLLIHADSSRIESAELHYDPEADRIWSDSATTRTLADGSVTSGTAFESDMSFENIRIEGARGGLRRVF